VVRAVLTVLRLRVTELARRRLSPGDVAGPQAGQRGTAVDRTDQATSTTTTATARAVRAFSVALLGVAVAVGVTLLALGAPAPAPGPVLLLALAAALCVNRFALFPSEHAATAEAAVLLAAVVGFRDDAAFLGPLVVALLVGPLDALHWEQRSFLRMVYNAGNRGVATLAATTAFVAMRDVVGLSSPAAWCLVVLVASAAFVIVDALLSTTLLRLTGEPFVAAARFVFDADALALPVACLGAIAGLLAGALGWWATALMLVPIAFVPELAIAHARRAASMVRDLVVLLVAVAALATFALVTPIPTFGTVAVLAAIAVLAGVEFGVDRSSLVPPMVALVVVAAVVVDGPHARFAAALVATVATITSWCSAGHASRLQMLGALATTFGAAVLAAEIAAQLPATMSGIAWGAFAAGLVFEAIAVMAGARWRIRGVRAWWTLPLLAAAVAWSMAARGLGVDRAGALLAVTLALAASCAAAAWWGAPAWPSRALGRGVRGVSPQLLLPTLAGVAIAAVVAAVLGAPWVSAGFGECAAAMAAMGVRQWRFAPRPRAIALMLLLVVVVAFVGGVPELVRAGSWWGPILAAALGAAIVAIAHQPAAKARAVAKERARQP